MGTNRCTQFSSQTLVGLPVLFIVLLFGHCMCEDTPAATPTNSGDESAPLLLVVVIDGLRWDAINTSHVMEKQCPPKDSCVDKGSFFTAVQKEGATAAWMSPVFPTTTTPNILTMATGELPVDHGVLGELRSHGEWNVSAGVQAVWDVATQRRLRTALLRWLDCAALQYDSEYLLCADRVHISGTENLLVEFTGDAALAADMLINGGYSAVLMRTEIISWTARHYGLNSPVTATMMTELRLVLDALCAELKQAGLWNELSIILTSGSGLSSTEPSSLEEVSVRQCLGTALPKVTRRFSNAGSVLIAPSEGVTADQLAAALSNCNTSRSEALRTYKMADLPPEDRWPGGPEELLVVANPGYFLKWDTETPHTSATQGTGRGGLAGDGFSVLDWDMNAVLIAKGPGIARGVTGESVTCPDVHALLQQMLTPPLSPAGAPLGSAAWMVPVSAAGVSLPGPGTLGLAVLFLSIVYCCSISHC